MQSVSDRQLLAALTLIATGLTCLVVASAIGYRALEGGRDEEPSTNPTVAGRIIELPAETVVRTPDPTQTATPEPTPVPFPGPISVALFDEKLAACGAYANGSVNPATETTRFFFSLPQDLFPDVKGFEFVSVDDHAHAGWISNAGRFGHAFDAKPGCWKYYYEFIGSGETVLTAQSPVSGAPEYKVHFIIEGPH